MNISLITMFKIRKIFVISGFKFSFHDSNITLGFCMTIVVACWNFCFLDNESYITLLQPRVSRYVFTCAFRAGILIYDLSLRGEEKLILIMCLLKILLNQWTTSVLILKKKAYWTIKPPGIYSCDSTIEEIVICRKLLSVKLLSCTALWYFENFYRTRKTWSHGCSCTFFLVIFLVSVSCLNVICSNDNWQTVFFQPEK